MASEQVRKGSTRGKKPARYFAAIPPHFEEANWLTFEWQRAGSLIDAVCLELERLSFSASAKHVHDSRVALRRWFSVWAVLKEDGWQSKKLERQVLKKLRRLLKSLGKLRDCDVNLELGKSFACPANVLACWIQQRKAVRRAVKKRIKRLDTAALLMRLRNHLQRRYEKLRAKSAGSPDKVPSTYEQLNGSVLEQEKQVKRLEQGAATKEELHELRLAIKNWRYLMSEFFGLTNLELVRAQQILGKLNDMENLERLLRPWNLRQVRRSIECARQKLLRELAEVRLRLPYGLRPVVVSRCSFIEERPGQLK